MPGAPPPNFGQIPLPPGMTLDQFESLQGSLSELSMSVLIVQYIHSCGLFSVTIALTVAVAFGILMWD
jgi:hypothetical protein